MAAEKMRFFVCFAVLLSASACGDGVTSRRIDSSSGANSLERQSSDRVSGDAGLGLRATCSALLDELPVQHELAAEAAVADVLLQSESAGRQDCEDFAWLKGVVSVAGLIDPEWAGPSHTTPWDCAHSSIEYGVYRRAATVWQYVDGGLAFGSLSADGVCSYSVDNFPKQPGTDSVFVIADDADGAELTEVRVGVRAWSHNDPALGHAGTACASHSCYWPSRVLWKAY